MSNEPTKSETKNALSYLEQFNVDCSSLTSRQVVDLESETKGQVSFLERHGANLEGKTIDDIKRIYQTDEQIKSALKADAVPLRDDIVLLLRKFYNV